MTESKKFSLVPEYGNINDPDIRAKYGYLEASVSIIGNTFLFLIKLLLGLMINSIALIADSFHTLSDVGTSGVVIFGFKMAKKPPDKEHPYGHGRAEYIATIFISVLLIITGFGFIEQSIERIIAGEGLIHSDYALLIGILIILTAAVKEAMAQYSTVIGRKIRSDILIADAWHHRSDAVASIAVGISIIGSSYGYPVLDPIFGIIVSVIIIYVGIDLIRKTSSILIGTAPDDRSITEIRNIVESIKNVRGVDEINIHDYGTSKIASLHVKVDPELNLNAAHSIADIIEEKIKQKMEYSTIVHIEPRTKKYDESRSSRIIENILKSQKDIVSFHKIQIIRQSDSDDIKMHVIVDRNMPIKASHDLTHDLELKIKKEYGKCNVDVHLEPCENDCKICSQKCDVRG